MNRRHGDDSYKGIIEVDWDDDEDYVVPKSKSQHPQSSNRQRFEIESNDDWDLPGPDGGGLFD